MRGWWPRRGRERGALSQALQFSQVDSTVGFGDDAALGPEDWIATVPLNSQLPRPAAMGLPEPSASAEEVFEIASRLSRYREAVSPPRDGVYCPVCHIANTQAARLRTPCPQCGRPLLSFGWD